MNRRILKQIGVGVAVTVAGVALVRAVDFQWDHYAWAGEAPEQMKINEDAIARVTILAEALGDRAASEDAAAAERRKLCLARQLHNEALCIEVGVDITQPGPSDPP